MTLKSIHDQYREQLGQIYPQQEIDSIYNLVIDHALGISRADRVLRAAYSLDSVKESELLKILERLKMEEPIQYILGKSEFYGLDLAVNSSVLIPRPETEELVRWILDSAENKAARILDLGTGSGCIPLALKKELPQAEVFGVDKSPEALKLADQNARMLHLDVEFELFDILQDDLKGNGSFDIMVSNPPYVRFSERELMKANVLKYEPEMALFVTDADPLVFYRRIADLGRDYLSKGGLLFFEINEKYGQEILEMLAGNGYTDTQLRRDLSGRDRMIKAKKT
jgi:release factor glutamine methyltransferase